MAILLSISTFNLLSFQDRTSVDTTVETLISDIKHQQLKSMTGATEGNPNPSTYGIYFQQNNYTLFTGATYTSTDPLNFSINVSETIQITTAFPQNRIIFGKGNGEIQGFTSGNNTITILHTPSNIQKVITLNKYGTIISIN